MNDLVSALGLVFVIEGLLYALAPGRLKAVMALAEKLPEEKLRTGGIIAVGLGVLIVWMARGTT